MRHKAIFSLDLENNYIDDIPSMIQVMETLVHLNLEGNNISNIPPELFSLKLLSTLALSRNNITTIPHEIVNGARKESMVDFEYLTFAGNKLVTLPERFFELKCANLDLRDNSLKTLPEWTTESTVGNHVYLSGNPLCNLALREALDKKYRKELDRLESQVPAEGCTPQCALTCFDYYRGSYSCDRGCNIKKCNFDDGDCEGA